MERGCRLILSAAVACYSELFWIVLFMWRLHSATTTELFQSTFRKITFGHFYSLDSWEAGWLRSCCISSPLCVCQLLHIGKHWKCVDKPSSFSLHFPLTFFKNGFYRNFHLAAFCIFNFTVLPSNSCSSPHTSSNPTYWPSDFLISSQWSDCLKSLVL